MKVFERIKLACSFYSENTHHYTEYTRAMTITTIQKVIKIGTSRGVTLPAKELERLGVKEGEEVEIIARKKTSIASNDKVQQVADSILSRYDQDFKNLAGR